MAYIKLVLFLSNLSFIYSLALSVNMISNFPHLISKPFTVEITFPSNGKMLTSDPSDTMVIRIIDKKLNEKEKYPFYYGSQDAIDSEFNGKYMNILLWEKNITSNKITLSIMFKLISHDMFIELFAFSESNKLQRRKILKDLNLAKVLLRERIDLFNPAKLNLSINSLNNNINNTNMIFSGNRVVASCKAYDGFPIHQPIFTIPDQINVTKAVYDEDNFESKIYFDLSINNHLQKLICKAGITSQSIIIYILHDPTSIFIDPEIDKLVEPITKLTCFVKDGYPAPGITWQIINGPENASMYYNIKSNGSQLFIKSNSPVNSNWSFKCSVKGYSKTSERLISFNIAVHPSQLHVEPEIKKWLQSNLTISCFIKEDNLNAKIKWELVKGPTNASFYYNILKNGSEIYMNTNNLPGTMWAFKCNAKIVITTTKIMNKTISFVIAKNFMEKCDEKCINAKLLEMEESIERNKKLHQDIDQMKSLINQSSLNFEIFNKNIANWKINIENKLDMFNQSMKTMKNESNENAVKFEKNNKLQHDIVDQIKLSINQSSEHFQRFSGINKDWKTNVTRALIQLHKTIETLETELDTMKTKENLKPTLLSRNKPTKQSSTYSSHGKSFISDYAVDGDVSQNFNKNHRCTHTNDDSGAFWMVDLKRYYKIEYILIYNRVDCCQRRLVGAIIEVLSRIDKVIDECGTISEVKNEYIFKCSSTPGQKIRIRLNRSNYLTLCEVLVFGLSL